MALNRPSGAELLAALREFLEKTVAPQVDPATQFNLRIANNVLGIVERELAQKGAADTAEAASGCGRCSPADQKMPILARSMRPWSRASGRARSIRRSSAQPAGAPEGDDGGQARHR